jgi:hypothetical protein
MSNSKTFLVDHNEYDVEDLVHPSRHASTKYRPTVVFTAPSVPTFSCEIKCESSAPEGAEYRHDVETPIGEVASSSEHPEIDNRNN